MTSLQSEYEDAMHTADQAMSVAEEKRQMLQSLESKSAVMERRLAAQEANIRERDDMIAARDAEVQRLRTQLEQYAHLTTVIHSLTTANAVEPQASGRPSSAGNNNLHRN